MSQIRAALEVLGDGRHLSGRRVHIEGADPAWNNRRSPAPLPQPPSGGGGKASPDPPAWGFADTANLERLAKNAADGRIQISELRARIHDLDARLAQLSVEEASAAGEAVAEATRQAAARYRGDLQQLSDRHLSENGRLRDGIRAKANALAPGIAGADWAEWDGAAGPVSRYLRFGQVNIGDLRLPAIAPFVGTVGWYLDGPRHTTDALLRSVVARVLGQASPKRLCLTVFDPRARGALGQFAQLRHALGAAFPVPTSDAQEMSERLRTALATSTTESEDLTANGFADLVEQWRSAPVPEGTLQLIVVFDYPHAVTDELEAQLRRAAAAEGPVRPSLLLAADDSASAGPSATAGHTLKDSLLILSNRTGQWRTALYPAEVAILEDEPPSAEVLTAVVAGASERARSDTGISFPLSELLAEDMAEPWRHDSAESIDVVIGRAGRGLLELSLRSRNPPHPNALVGGAVGTGKSNLLLAIIYGLATRYSPDQLELHLLDFKQGVEFARFAPDSEGSNWLPHVKTLGLESDRDFGLAVLRFLNRELVSRGELFKRAGASSLDQYRSKTGECMPRILLIVDEFHVLFSGDDDHVEEAVTTLEQLARQGRSSGVHLLLASQTPSGVAALAVKGESIFAQFPIRISLKNTSAESEAILSPGNKAAASLSYRGEVVFNSNLGLAADGSNQLGVIAHAESEAMAALQRLLWRKGHDEPPLLFNGAQYARWPSGPLPMAPDGLAVWIGQPITTTNHPYCHTITEDADQAVAVIGKPDAARTALRAMALSSLGSLSGGRIVVLDGEGEEAEALVSEIAEKAAVAGIGLERFDRREAGTWVRRDLSARLGTHEGQPKLLVLGLSFQRLHDMDLEETPESEESSDDDELELSLDNPSESARSVLARAAHDGAKNGVFLVGSWANLRTMEADLGAYSPGVSTYVTAELGLDDLRTIAGHAVHPIAGIPRLGVFETSGDGRLQVLVPYDPGGTSQVVGT